MTTATEYDAYALSSGLIDDFDANVTEAYFGTDASYNGGDSVLLFLNLATDDVDTPVITEKLSVGSGWVVENGGQSVVKENGRPSKFNKNSRVGMVLAAALNSGAGDTMRAKGSPMEASTWQGLGFHWNRIEIEGFNGDKKDVLLPTAFLGGGTGTHTQASLPSEAVGPATRAKLSVIAKKAGDYDTFIATVLDDADFADDAAAIELALDPSFFASVNG